MTTSALIDLVLNYTDNVSATDADNTTRRARILQYAQEVCDEVRSMRDWPFKYDTLTLTGTAGNNFIEIPSATGVLESLSYHGNLYRGTTKMHEVALGHLFRARQTGLSTFPISDIFSWGMINDASTDADDTEFRIQLAITLTVNTSYELFGVAAPVTLVDQTNATNKLPIAIPAAFHNTVVLPGVIARVKREKGEEGNYWQIYQRGIADMASRLSERKSVTNRMPRAVSSW